MTVTVIQIGLHPDVIDYASPDFVAFAGLAREKLREANDDNLALLREAGYEADGCQIDFGETALDKIRGMLAGREYDAVLIGAGVRLAARNTPLFESIVNLVHTTLPRARFIFNYSAEATPDDIRRYFPDPASSVAQDVPGNLAAVAVVNPGNALRACADAIATEAGHDVR
ncbi:hypothetical protein [Nocardia lijiangensis]|uniref:hypothetical protein n=1 Tax=Nocardia lijiangensis TaxID=299618 RepID=UPI00082BD8B3|nr:hypothetical protein [Nocardia lijiangensis]